jgi:hypothetical protein
VALPEFQIDSIFSFHEGCGIAQVACCGVSQNLALARSTVKMIARSKPNNDLSRETADDWTWGASIWDGFNRRSDFNEFDKGAV